MCVKNKTDCVPTIHFLAHFKKDLDDVWFGIKAVQTEYPDWTGTLLWSRTISLKLCMEILIFATKTKFYITSLNYLDLQSRPQGYEKAKTFVPVYPVEFCIDFYRVWCAIETCLANEVEIHAKRCSETGLVEVCLKRDHCHACCVVHSSICPSQVSARKIYLNVCIFMQLDSWPGQGDHDWTDKYEDRPASEFISVTT